MEVIGGHCSSTAVFVNAHHSIGIRALVLFGTPEQKARWLPAPGPRREAGGLRPDRGAGRLRRRATCRRRPRPAADGQTYVLNGTKRYITNGAIADVLTVMARTPDPARGRVEGHRLPGHARHARLRGRRGADAQVRHPRARRRRGWPSTTCRSRPRTSSGPLGKGLEGRADRARLRPHDLRRELHRDWPRSAWPPPPATPPSAGSSAGRWPSSSWSRRSSPSWPRPPTRWRRRPTRPPP